MSGVVASLVSRPQPVRVMAVVLAVLAFLTGAAGLGDLIPKLAMAWMIVTYGAIQVAWGAWTATQVTPLAAPQAADGTELVPVGSAAAAPLPAVPTPADPVQPAAGVPPPAGLADLQDQQPDPPR